MIGENRISGKVLQGWGQDYIIGGMQFLPPRRGKRKGENALMEREALALFRELAPHVQDEIILMLRALSSDGEATAAPPQKAAGTG